METILFFSNAKAEERAFWNKEKSKYTTMNSYFVCSTFGSKSAACEKEMAFLSEWLPNYYTTQLSGKSGRTTER
jgi:hypothetical protein